MGHTAYTIETGIPIPRFNTAQREQKYPYAHMDIGDSFFVPGASTKTMNSSITYAKKKYGCKYVVRTMDDGVRVWRIE